MLCFFFNDTATTEIYTLSLHDALPIWLGLPAGAAAAGGGRPGVAGAGADRAGRVRAGDRGDGEGGRGGGAGGGRSEEHTSELQSSQYLVFRLLLEKKKIIITHKSPICC